MVFFTSINGLLELDILIDQIALPGNTDEEGCDVRHLAN